MLQKILENSNELRQLVVFNSSNFFFTCWYNPDTLRMPQLLHSSCLENSACALICTQNALSRIILVKVLLIILVPDKFVLSGPSQKGKVWIKHSLQIRLLGKFIAVSVLDGFFTLPDNPKQEVCYLRHPL